MPESATFDRILELATRREVLISDHAYEKAEKEGILITSIIAALADAEVIEDYPNAWKGPSVLLLHSDVDGNAIHTVWGLARGSTGPAALITCYKPDPLLWSYDFRKRKP